MSNKAKQDYIELTMNRVLSPSRRKAIKTIMKERNLSFEGAKKLQARRIAESKNGLDRNELKV